MAKYRPIYMKIWHDPDFQNLSVAEKLIFIYLCTNTSTTESGIYPITYKSISQETGIQLTKVKNALSTNKITNISYDADSRTVFIRNFLKYNGKGVKIKALESLIQDMKYINTPFWAEFTELYPQWVEKAKELEDKLTPIPMPTPTPIVNLTPNPSANPNPNPIPTLKANHTPHNDMRMIFLTYWQEHNPGRSYTIADNDNEISIAEELYQLCKQDGLDDPLAYFEERVKYLVDRFDIKQFTGLIKYWNSYPDRTY